MLHLDRSLHVYYRHDQLRIIHCSRVRVFTLAPAGILLSGGRTIHLRVGDCSRTFISALGYDGYMPAHGVVVDEIGKACLGFQVRKKMMKPSRMILFLDTNQLDPKNILFDKEEKNSLVDAPSIYIYGSCVEKPKLSSLAWFVSHFEHYETDRHILCFTQICSSLAYLTTFSEKCSAQV